MFDTVNVDLKKFAWSHFVSDRQSVGVFFVVFLDHREYFYIISLNGQ